ncbi:FkbM family methyltransferase [Dechloromonas denitrificans]|uniref:FkbM family methyltransferase n=1 Tax=Dechloromonas denitrificans TaxID=281362 RepID=UPI001CFA5683|nr:FkbM family methyltransferase [Dechloromonas denitrificans]UCV05943.1 FkbM family methyltransferase [Dechloromonas denitrificans]
MHTGGQWNGGGISNRFGEGLQMVKGLRKRVAQMALPIARFYIRYMPFSTGKSFLFKRFGWRDSNYTVRTKSGVRMAGRSADLVQGFIYYFGVWEPNLSAFVSSRLKEHPERTFVDVGANVGYFSLLAASHLDKGSVVAIEAFPSIFKKLEANVRLNGFDNIRLLPWAVTDGDRDIPMFHAGLGNEGATTSLAGKFGGEPLIVPGKALPSLLTAQEIRSIKLIKIDVEGAEYSVVVGMRSLLDSLADDAEVVIEMTPSAYSEGELEEVFAIFRAARFTPYKLENSYDPNYYIRAPRVAPPQRLQSLPTQQTDVVFSRFSAEILN